MSAQPLSPKPKQRLANERIDLSVFRRCQLYPAYRPPNLLEWARRKGLELKKVIACPEQFPDLYKPVTQPLIERHCPEPQGKSPVPALGPPA